VRANGNAGDGRRVMIRPPTARIGPIKRPEERQAIMNKEAR